MKSFALVNPSTLGAALEHLAKHERAQVLAGGQDLLTELKEHLVEPAELVNLKRIPGLDRIEFAADGSLTIGALATVSSLAEHPRIVAELPVLAQAARSVGSEQIRNIGTLGGNLCQRPRCWYYRSEHAHCLKKGGTECFSYAGASKYNAIVGGGPSYIVHPSDLAPALVALNAEVTLASSKGERKLPLERFFVLPADGDVLRENVLAPGEIVASVRVPPREPGTRSTYLKFKERGSFDFALSSVALVATLADGGRKIKTASIVLGGIAPVPWRETFAQAKLAGASHEPSTWKAAAQAALPAAEPLAHNAYKVPLTRNLIVKALESLAGA